VGILIQVLPFGDPKPEKQVSGRLKKVQCCTCQHIARGSNGWDGAQRAWEPCRGRPTLGGGPLNKPHGGGTENGLLLIGRKVQRSCRSASFHFSDNGWRGCVNQTASGGPRGEKRLPIIISKALPVECRVLVARDAAALIHLNRGGCDVVLCGDRFTCHQQCRRRDR
jgi:hypothetical protein